MIRLSNRLALACALSVTIITTSLHGSNLQPSDQQLSAEIETQLQLHNGSSGSHIKVSVTGGIANLSGEVATYAARMQAERICYRVAGISSVANRLQVVPTLVGDEKLAGSVMDRISADVLVRPQHIKVAAVSGVVSLTGSVATWAERRHAAAAARQVLGVKEVRNELSVIPSEESPRLAYDQSRVALQLEQLLQGESPLAELELEFQLSQGQVVLAGIVPSVRQKNFLRELIYTIPGVEEVDMRGVRVLPTTKVSPINFVDEDTSAANQTAVQMVINASSADRSQAVNVKLDDRGLVLEGIVQSLAQQQRLMQLAKAFSGTTSVRNRLSVTPIARDDHVIERELRNTLDNDAILSNADIVFTVDKGQATLSGTVPNFNAKARAARVTSRIAGLVGIDNRLTVLWSPNVSDDGLKKVIEKKLHEKFGNQVSAIDVSVVEGAVTLSGRLEHAELEQQLVDVVEGIDCVRSVRCELTANSAAEDVANR